MALFRITAYLGTPVVLGKTYLTLDAVLYGILAELREIRGIDADPLKDIPLARTDGVFHASRACFNRAVYDSEIKTGGIRAAKDLADAPLFLQSTRGQHPKVSTVRGPLKANLTRYQSIAAESVSWIADGDADKALRLLDGAGAIGARRKDGHGAVTHIEVEAADGLSALIDAGSEVRRPIPVRLAKLWGLAPVSLTAIDSWRPPYWEGSGAEECYIPRPD